MKICVVGLGIIGASICKSLKRNGVVCDGWDVSPSVLDYALKNSVIKDKSDNFALYDVVFIALPPEATINFINSASFKDRATVCDICGVKGCIEDEVYARKRNFNYVGAHPMAGKEVSGIENSSENLFDRASMIVTVCHKTDGDALSAVKELIKLMGFKYYVECSAETHDKKIAYTSQLAHIVSSAYVKNPELDGCNRFTGGSFQDMTRIAGVDERVWSELYLKNAENLSENIGRLIVSLQNLKDAIDNKDAENLKKLLKDGAVLFAENNKNLPQNGIYVENLK